MKSFPAMMIISSLVFLAGCAPTLSVDESAQESSSKTDPSPVTQKDLVQVVCKAAYPQGCRHLGHIYPWNAWLDISGYDSADYAVVKIERNGGRATVFLEKLDQNLQSTVPQ